MHTEAAMSLIEYIIVALCLLFLYFMKILITDANLDAWTKISQDKELAKEVKRKKDQKRRGGNVRIPQRISERELLSTAWFGGPCGLVAMFVKRHKIRKPMFLLGYCCRCIAGVCLVCVALFLTLSLMSYWASVTYRYNIMRFIKCILCNTSNTSILK